MNTACAQRKMINTSSLYIYIYMNLLFHHMNHFDIFMVLIDVLVMLFWSFVFLLHARNIAFARLFVKSSY